ncbi:TonB-dependent receptor plug domain-containing protein [Horticoccus sp. 23ND18S-11]|uniref:TonB-dependent receptor plug domain-containing protein n=1 Tax=Horticoccus sp. 23ND18S-11 TaxID=3391832 RepID=UPI0039C94F29
MNRLLAAPLGALLGLAPLRAQQAPPAVSPTQEARALARYDLNKNGRLDPEERAAMQADEARAAQGVAGTKTGAEGERVVELTPFEVNAAADKGYYASSTMSGTRLNSRIEDLAASITVVTKQQLLDTAAIDINDIFLYEANTEGTGQFTDFVIDRGNVVDNVAGSPSTANRVRGLSAANIAVGNFASTSSIPVDTYNVDAVEISRGPNSSIFGLGDASGTINLIQARANLTREISSFSGRVDSYEGFRFTTDLNRPLLRGNANGGMRLAARVSAVYEEKGYMRKPSMDRTNRVTFGLNFQPFKNTRFSGSYETYHNFNQRPNATPPRDTISFWRAAGSPTWLPLTQQVRLRGVLSGPTADAALPFGLFSHGTSMVRIQEFVDQGKVALLTRGNRPDNANLRFMVSGTDIQRGVYNGVASPLYNMPVVKDRSIYDYEDLNLVAANYGYLRSDIYNAELEQTFVKTSRHLLALQAGWRREDTENMSRNFVGQSDGAPSTLQIDVNETLLDGSPNPFFLRPFIGGNEPQVFRRPVLNDNYRATVAYQLDLRNESNLLKWAGKHAVAAYGEYREIIQAPSGHRYRDQVVNVGDPFIPPGTTNIPTRNDAHLFPRYYIGDATNQNVDYASTRPEPGNGSFTSRVYDPATTSWRNQNVDIREIYFALGTQKRQIHTQGVVLQSFLWKDRIIPTLGWRKDHNYSIDNLGTPIDPATALFNTSNLFTFGQNKRWTQGATKQKGVVVKPFTGWGRIDEAAGRGNVLAELARGLAVHYNQSDSFQPADTQYNVFGDALPNPTGTGKDYGVSFNNVLGSRLSVRISKYETLQTAARGSIGVISTRANRLDFGTDGFNLQRQSTIWFQTLNPTWSVDQVNTEVARVMGMTQQTINYITGKPINDTNSAASKGWEVEMSYNPSRFWTMKLAGARQQAIDSNLSPNLQRYLEERLPIWTTVRIPTGLDPNGQQLPNAGQRWWDVRTNDTPSLFYTGNVLAPLKLAITTQGKPKPQTRQYSANFITNYRLAGLFPDHRWLKNFGVGGSARYASKGAIGFLAGRADADGIVRELDGSKPIYDKATIKVDLLATYDFRFNQNKVRGRVQLNVRDALENGHLQRISVNPDGTPWNYRIIDPRQFILTTTFDL